MWNALKVKGGKAMKKFNMRTYSDGVENGSIIYDIIDENGNYHIYTLLVKTKTIIKEIKE